MSQDNPEEESTTEKPSKVEKTYEEMERDERDEMISESLASISSTLAELKAARAAEPGTAIQTQYATETARAIAETTALQLEGAQFNTARQNQKVRSLRAHSEGFLSERVDNEEMLTERLGDWAAREAKFDKTLAARSKQLHPRAAQIERLLIIVGIIVGGVLLIYEATQPAFVVGIGTDFNGFTSDPYKAAWLLGLVIAVAIVAVIGFFVWRRREEK